MTAPIPEERDEHTLPTEGTPPGEHEGELPDDTPDGESVADEEQEHNAGTTEDQPSQ